VKWVKLRHWPHPLCGAGGASGGAQTLAYINCKPVGLQGLTSMVRVSVAELPAASLAVTVMILSSPQWRLRAEIVQLVVPEAVPLPPRLLVQVTLVTPTLSAAVPLRVMLSSSVE